MKKVFLWLLVISMIAVCSLVGCKEEAAEEEVAEEEEVAAVEYVTPVPIEAQATFANIEVGDTIKLVYMPPATEFNYYMAIGAGIESLAEELNVEYSMLAPQSGADINGQMTMLQDVITQDVDAIILSTHDENAAAPLVAQV